MKKISILIILLLSVTVLPATPIMKLSEIRSGMEGIGKTIFKGTKIETFDFKVLGIIEKFAPGKNLIIVKLDSSVLSDSGVIAGMSGSPAYINGRLIGAVAYGFSFQKTPIAGVTPIEDIIKTSDYNTPIFTVDITDIKFDFDQKNTKKISGFIQRELEKRANYSPRSQFSPIKLLFLSKGMEQSSLSYLSQISTQITNIKVQQKSSIKPLNKDLFSISPADAVAIPLIRGDFAYYSSGTVTHVDGKKIFLFGHPLYNLGTINFPLHKAEVITVVPSYQESFRLSIPKHMIGAVVQDRFSAIMAELGRVPYMIPMKVFLKNRNRSFNLELVNHQLLTPALSMISLNNIFSAEYQEYGYQSFEIKGKIFIKDEKNIIINDIFTGTGAVNEFSNLILAINFFIMHNKEKSIKIQKMDFEVSGSESIKRSDIENVMINKNSFQPGELIDLNIHLKNERGQPWVEQIKVRTPQLQPGAPFFLIVADKNEMTSFDSKNTRSNYFPAKLNALIRAINNLRKNNKIYIKLFTPSRGLFIKGYEYSNLPMSLKNVFDFNTQVDSRSVIKYSTLMEYQLTAPAVVKGKKVFKLKIKER